MGNIHFVLFMLPSARLAEVEKPWNSSKHGQKRDFAHAWFESLSLEMYKKCVEVVHGNMV